MLEKIQGRLLQISRNPFVKQSLITLILRVLGVVTLFGFTIFLTKTYSAKIIGQYDFVRSFLLAIGSICLLGFDQSILYFKGRLSAQNALDQLKSIYIKMVLMLFVTSLTALIVIFLINEQTINNYFSDEEVYPLFLKTAACLFFYGIATLNTEVFRALDKLYVAELFRNVIKYVPLIIGAIILFYWHKESYLADVFLAGFVLLSLISSILVYYYFKDTAKILTAQNISHKEVFLKSYPIAISGMAIFLLMCFDIMFLKKYRNTETVAFYSIGVKLMTIVSVIVLTINITVSAKIAAFFVNNDLIELKKAVRNSVRLIFGITFPVIVLMCIFSEYILSFFGTQYIAAKEAFLILIIGQGVCSAFGTAPVYLNMTGRSHTFQVILITAVIINFVLNRFLIPIYGMTGAAIAFVLSSFFWNFVSAIIIYRKDKVTVFLH
ncbi:MATE family efflux transporter [Flavobacterium sp. HJJ]|uniref:MATE family efflux transporter n=1 Tax=Flavobacterium sp. HJJ TaxID=2783792 RepID=UPI00188D278C|nr:MATE family efflux transporter [Flavobacterium sp. HJJ]MBF4472806.1 oligosaccharide flippase family protein [Flavobacterium sp. HJJ]